jgi:hypothetical protein
MSSSSTLHLNVRDIHALLVHRVEHNLQLGLVDKHNDSSFTWVQYRETRTALQKFLQALQELRHHKHWLFVYMWHLITMLETSVTSRGTRLNRKNIIPITLTSYFLSCAHMLDWNECPSLGQYAIYCNIKFDTMKVWQAEFLVGINWSTVPLALQYNEHLIVLKNTARTVQRLPTVIQPQPQPKMSYKDVLVSSSSAPAPAPKPKAKAKLVTSSKTFVFVGITSGRKRNSNDMDDQLENENERAMKQPRLYTTTGGSAFVVHSIRMQQN